ncbi:hypothetical protein [Paenarthrobacter sp. 2TAF44]|uniref:hypothetical protein n=1 Tax=Paenarthrobacter sp. 2TAF44 TaxID=3233018 RepID=UPI003F999B12
MTHDESALLSLELVPKTVFGENLRNRLTRTEWEKCKKYAKQTSGNVCGICGGTGAKGRLDCHERWEWIEAGELHTQKLVGLTALCPRCHSAKHYGRAQIIGYADDVNDQLMTVNGWSVEELQDHLRTSRNQWRERSAHQWTLNFDWLVATLGIMPGPPRKTAFSVPPLSKAKQLKQAEEKLSHLQGQLMQARYRVKYAKFWKTKITVPEAGEQRSAEAAIEAKEAAKCVRIQKALVEQLAEELKREQKAARAAKRPANKTPPGPRASPPENPPDDGT